jgi:catechol 2,3-dioxygenase-like lactoylglutathione lyase family enzyme
MGGSDGPQRPWADVINAITLFQEDLAEAKRFYQGAFGLSLVFEDANSAVFKIGDTLVNLLRVPAAHELVEPATVAERGDGARAVMTVHVADVDGLCAQLVARGVSLLNGPIDRPWGPRTASFTDPGGHIWEIAQ